MGVDTKAIIRKGVSVEEIKTALELKYKGVSVEASDSQMFRFFFTDGKNERMLWVSFSGTCLRDEGIDGVWCSLGMWGNSVEIMKYLCETFGGYIDENDCDDKGFYPINFELYQNSKEYTELDLFINKVISKLGYDKLNAAMELFNEFKNLK